MFVPEDQTIPPGLPLLMSFPRTGSHWLRMTLTRAVRHWHEMAQLSLDVDLARLLSAQAVGLFDIRLLPTLAQPLAHQPRPAD